MRWWTVPGLWRASSSQPLGQRQGALPTLTTAPTDTAISSNPLETRALPTVAQEDISNLQPRRTSLNGLGKDPRPGNVRAIPSPSHLSPLRARDRSACRESRMDHDPAAPPRRRPRGPRPASTSAYPATDRASCSIGKTECFFARAVRTGKIICRVRPCLSMPASGSSSDTHTHSGGPHGFKDDPRPTPAHA
ncbi:MAG: hypothetical protein RLZZ450_2317 [Pseudomonadota bacterium]|jgi:hypothetical protein